MTTENQTEEFHRSERIGWLRAAVLGANDGIVSTASLIVGVASAHATHHNIVLSGASGLAAGAMSMAAGEYVSVSSQFDTEQADLALEKAELEASPDSESEELAQIYVKRGLKIELARQVADQLMVHDALGSHARDELGSTEIANARPVQAAIASAASFTLGAAFPLLISRFAPMEHLVFMVSIASLGFLMLLGGLAAKAGGASLSRGAFRVVFWGAFAMAVTAGIGSLFGTNVTS